MFFKNVLAIQKNCLLACSLYHIELILNFSGKHQGFFFFFFNGKLGRGFMVWLLTKTACCLRFGDSLKQEILCVLFNPPFHCEFLFVKCSVTVADTVVSAASSFFFPLIVLSHDTRRGGWLLLCCLSGLHNTWPLNVASTRPRSPGRPAVCIALQITVL